MDVNRVANYQPVAPPPPPVAPTGGAEAAAPVAPVRVEAAPQPVEASYNVERIEATIEQLERAVAEINQTISSYQRHLSVSLHQATGRHMVTVYNTDTSEVIREIPPQRVLDAHVNLLEMAGLMLDTRG